MDRFRLWLGRSPRILAVLIFLTTTLVMTALGWWMMWAREHHRWDHIAIFLIGVVVLCLSRRYWDRD